MEVPDEIMLRTKCARSSLCCVQHIAQVSSPTENSPPTSLGKKFHKKWYHTTTYTRVSRLFPEVLIWTVHQLIAFVTKLWCFSCFPVEYLIYNIHRWRLRALGQFSQETLIANFVCYLLRWLTFLVGFIDRKITRSIPFLYILWASYDSYEV